MSPGGAQCRNAYGRGSTPSDLAGGALSWQGRVAVTPLAVSSGWRPTAVATLELVGAGKLTLDDTVGKRLPEYPNKDVASKVTVRHVLTHTGGTGDIFGPTSSATVCACASTATT
jgi:hypothetical protein